MTSAEESQPPPEPQAEEATEPDTSGEVSSSPVLSGETVAFTGTLASMPHRKALEIVERHGGSSVQHVSRHLTMLVVGEEGWPLEDDGRPSQKLKHALQLQAEGVALRVINESEWLYIVGLNDHREEVHRVYTPAMLSRLLDVPVEQIRSWERAGLIRPVRKVYRLPYFDFQEVTSARKLNQLVTAGVPIQEIQSSLTSLQGMFDDIHRALQQLTILSRSPHVIYRDENGPISPRTGQRLFDFEQLEVDESTTVSEASDRELDEPIALRFPAPCVPTGPRTGEQLLVGGCQLADSGELQAAIDMLRECLIALPGDPEANFHLADCLYRTNQIEAAIERLYVTVEFDPEFVEAWTQLGCLLADIDQLEQARTCLQTAITIHPDYADAHWHLANLLEQSGDLDEAIDHWQAYLEFDTRGPWAEDAADRITAWQTSQATEPESAAAEETESESEQTTPTSR